jgi:hypothetical protein
VFLFFYEVRHGSDRDLIKGKSHGASKIDSLFLLFIGQVGAEELKSQDNILDTGVILHFLGQRLIVSEKRRRFARGHKVLILRFRIFGTLDPKQEVQLSTK